MAEEREESTVIALLQGEQYCDWYKGDQLTQPRTVCQGFLEDIMSNNYGIVLCGVAGTLLNFIV